MIRVFHMQDLDQIMKLWLDTNIGTHSFIHSEYWLSNYDFVKNSMPNATIYVDEEDHVMQGFIGLLDHMIAGIFVAQQFQSKGIGKKLLDTAKAHKSMLTLQVYKKNQKAIHFYLREDFVIKNERIDEETGEIEYCMTWQS